MSHSALLLVILGGICEAAFASDWPKYCANLEMTGVAPSGGNLSTVTAKNLALQWSLQLAGPIASSPTIADGRLYIGDWAGYEWAIDAESGTMITRVNLGTTTSTQCNPKVLGITSAAAISDGTLFLAGGDDDFYALDPQTLEVRWQQRLGNSLAGYYGWGSPAVFGGLVLQGVSSNCDTPFVPGRLVGLSNISGTVEANRMFAPQNSWQEPLGGGVWTSPAVDVDNESVFVTTGSAYDLYDGTAFSIVRLSLPDLKLEESWRITTQDWSDSDWGTSPTLFTDPQHRQLVGAGQKDGSYYAFDRQFLRKGPTWQTRIATAGNCPQCGDGILSTAAFDGKQLYVGGGQPEGDPAHWGSITALDPADGHILWQRAFARPVIAPISYTNGVLFTTMGKSAIALDAATGEILASYATRAECVGGVAITDHGIYFGDLSGRLYCLRAPDVPQRRRTVVAH